MKGCGDWSCALCYPTHVKAGTGVLLAAAIYSLLRIVGWL